MCKYSSILFKDSISIVYSNSIPYTDALLAPSDATLAYPGCAILLDGQKTWLSRQIHCPFLPDSSSHPGCKGAKKSVGGGQKRVRVRYQKLVGNVGPLVFVKKASKIN